MAETPPAHPTPLPPPEPTGDQVERALIEARDLCDDVVKLTASGGPSPPFNLIARSQALAGTIRHDVLPLYQGVRAQEGRLRIVVGVIVLALVLILVVTA